MKSQDKFTNKELAFVREYVKCNNATQAAISAGYSENSAEALGCRLLAKPKIQAELSRRVTQISERVDVKVSDVLKVMKAILTFDPRDLYHPDGSIKPPNEWSDEVAMAIQGFDVTELFDGNGDARHAFGMIKKIKLADRMKAADTLVKVLGMIQPERIEVSGSVQVQPTLDLSKWATEDLERLHDLQTKYKELDANIIDADTSD